MERRVDAAVVVLSTRHGTTMGTRTSLPTTFSAILVPRMANRKWCGAVDVIRSTRMVLDGGGSGGGASGWEGESAWLESRGKLSHGFNAGRTTPGAQLAAAEGKDGGGDASADRRKGPLGEGLIEGVDRNRSQPIFHHINFPSIEVNPFETLDQTVLPQGSDQKPLGRSPGSLEGDDANFPSKISDTNFP